MKTYSTKNIRNVVLLGSTKSGKTTLSEAMLYEGKVIDRRGTVEGKNTVSDNAEIEQMNQRNGGIDELLDSLIAADQAAKLAKMNEN